MNFNNKAQTYDQNAELQRTSSDRLFRSLCDREDSDFIRILEIGCGTGYLTRKLIKKYPNSQIHALDISAKMLEESQLDSFPQVQTVLADAENYSSDESYDLIISNLSFQWFNEQIKTIQKYKKMLVANGRLYINTLMDGSYQDFIRAFEDNNISYPGLRYLKKSEFQKDLNQSDSLSEYNISESFPNTQAFLKRLHAIGAKNSSSLNAAQLRQIIRTHDSFFTAEIQVQYKILEIIINKGTQC